MKKYAIEFETTIREGNNFLLAESAEQIEKMYCEKYLIKDIKITEVPEGSWLDTHHVFMPITEYNI